MPTPPDNDKTGDHESARLQCSAVQCCSVCVEYCAVRCSVIAVRCSVVLQCVRVCCSVCIDNSAVQCHAVLRRRRADRCNCPSTRPPLLVPTRPQQRNAHLPQQVPCGRVQIPLLLQLRKVRVGIGGSVFRTFFQELRGFGVLHFLCPILCCVIILVLRTREGGTGTSVFQLRCVRSSLPPPVPRLTCCGCCGWLSLGLGLVGPRSA